MIARLNTRMQLSEVPDSVHYRVLNGDGGLVTENDSNHVTAQTSPTGSQVAIEYDLPDLPEGNYQIEFDLDNRVHSTEYRVDSAGRVLDGYVSLNGTIDTEVATEDGTWELFRENRLIGLGSILSGRVNTVISNGKPGLDSYMMVVTDTSGAIADYEVFWITPTILRAVRELRSTLDRLQRELRLDALEMDDIDYLRALQRGRDRFNALSYPTAITMNNAQGPIRGLWLVAAQVEAMRVRFLEEGLTNYDYQGSSVTLSVEVRDTIDQYIVGLEARLETEGRVIKSDLERKGQRSGDGTWSAGNRVAVASGVSLGLLNGYGGIYSPANSRLPRIR